METAGEEPCVLILSSKQPYGFTLALLYPAIFRN
jgi:hypothetical protein